MRGERKESAEKRRKTKSESWREVAVREEESGKITLGRRSLPQISEKEEEKVNGEWTAKESEKERKKERVSNSNRRCDRGAAGREEKEVEEEEMRSEEAEMRKKEKSESWSGERKGVR